ncbi:hypothetical protein DPMN_067197 [Dreissena polymorpha]|uniref:Uncharacterized protein n=1 Tax=Dreissena polymorpha TaxID=45954 RepID=A0A9D3YWV7_DREPO|nr:hypothetical protein DPMN_067197 [Dreissena polymorpha]
MQHRSGRKHVNVDSLSRIPSEPGACECYEGHLTLTELPCKGCDTCSRKHKQWSYFSQFDDAVPLFAKRNAETAQTSGSSKARVSRVKLQESGFWSWIFVLLQLLVMKLFNCASFMYCGLIRIRKYCRYRIYRLRFHENSDNPDADHSSKSGDRNFEMQNKGELPSFVKSLVKFGTVNCSPQRMARLQQQDPDIGVVVNWLKYDCQRPPRDTVSGCSPIVRNLWLDWDL